MSLLKAQNLVKSYNSRVVVKGVDIEIASGEIVGFLGRNGAGKTTSFQIIAGLIKPDSGMTYLDNKDISKLTAPQRALEGITYLPQESSVFLNASVEENLKIILEFQPLEKTEQKGVIRRLLGELGLSHLSKQPAHSLSGGERRRLEICRSLILQPKFLFLDEPFTGIDPLTIIELQKIILNLKKKNIGIVISDHNVRDTLKVTDRAYIIDNGSILIKGPPKKIANDKTAKKAFFGENFKLRDEVSYYSSRRKNRSPGVSPRKYTNKKK